MELHERVEILEEKLPLLEDAVNKIIERLVEVDTMLATLHGVQKMTTEVINERLPDASPLVLPGGPSGTPGEYSAPKIENSGG